MSEIPTSNINASFDLASGSPRRRQLLAEAGFSFEIIRPEVDETPRPGEPPLEYVRRMAAGKSAAGFAMTRGRRPSLGADTVIVLGARIVGKPADYEDAVRILSMLSGRSHNVVTSVALTTGYGVTAIETVSTEVVFRPLSQAEIRAYCDTGEPMDKSGAYAIQGGAAGFVAFRNGSVTNVVGLPMEETAIMLASYGIFPLNLAPVAAAGLFF
ncbi:MAG: septum formation inhibitor Maf [Succinivibrionaceae bacterium]|nr:septum formation inhibitor Maf [Succinivibrionaceae bacterium]